MSNSLKNVAIAELMKLRTLPAAPITIATTILGTAGLAVVIAVSALQQPGFEKSIALETGLRTVDYGQIGLIMLGILTAASEYSGSQIRTTLASVPSRILLVAAKTIAYLTVAVLTALLVVAASTVAAQATLGERGGPVSAFFVARNFGALLGATTYLVLIGMLSYGVAVLTRNLVAALVAMLTLVLVVPPLLTTVTTLAEYLPSSAGSQSYQFTPAAGALTPWQGAAILGGWTLLTLFLAVIAFTKRDA
jgi:ABC-type transport system involved in multi-copper enzyme maturation permease subunit